MGKIYTVLFFMWSGLLAMAQNNVTTFSFPERTSDVERKIEEIPDWGPTNARVLKNSATSVDNSKLKYFPPVFNQKGNSCSQASGFGYIFTYEMNALRNTDAALRENRYSYHYTWNYLNDGDANMGSWYFDGFEIAKDNGVARVTDMDDEAANEKNWMHGYEKYYRSMQQGVKKYSKINAAASDGLDNMKRYLTDHGNGSAHGGLIVFSGKTSNWQTAAYSGASQTGIAFIVKKFGDGGDHAMTIVGYDDMVECDVNENGTIEAEEKGAFIVVNSWGNWWGDKGKFYMPYQLLKLNEWNGGIGNGDKYVYVIEVEERQPTLTAKVEIEYSSRNDLKFKLGIASDYADDQPKYIKYSKIMQNQGGDHYMQGGDYYAHKTIEVGFDLSDLAEYLDEEDSPKFFLTLFRDDIGQSAGNGVIKRFSVMDYRMDPDQPKEYECQLADLAIDSRTELNVTYPDVGISDDELKMVDASFVVYPNPFVNSISVQYALPEASDVYITIRSISGQILYQSATKSVAPNLIQRDLINEINGLPLGSYILTLNMDGQVLSRKLIKVNQ